MLNISVNLTTGRATAVQAPVVKAGGDVPVVISFSANPGDTPVIELALSPQSSSPDVKAYLDVFVAQNSTTYTGTLDANDTRLIALLAGKQAQTLDCEIVVTTDAGRKPFPNFAVTVQPPVITGPESSEGGPVYLPESVTEARYARKNANLLDLEDPEEARENLGLATMLCRVAVAGPVTFETEGEAGQYWWDAENFRLWVYVGGQFRYQTLISEE